MDRETNTPRLSVAALTGADTDDLAALLMDGAIYQAIGDAPADVTVARARVRRWVAGSPDTGIRWINHVARHVDTRDIIGLCQATVSLNADGSADEITIAYIVDPRHQGRGHAAEMMATFLDELVAGLLPILITAHIAPGHIPSERVAARLGLSPTGGTDDDGENVWSRVVE